MGISCKERPAGARGQGAGRREGVIKISTTVDDTSNAEWKDYCRVYEWITLHCSAEMVVILLCLDTLVFIKCLLRSLGCVQWSL